MFAYLDNSATTRPFDQAIDAMTRCMRDTYFNPAALYTPAMLAEQAITKAKRGVGESVGATEKDVIFTSGGTESNNLAIIGHMIGQRKDGVILYTAAEHPAVKNACIEAAVLHGQMAREIPLTQSGMVDLVALENMLDSRVRLICVMQVCNETGVIMPLSKVVRLRDRLAPDAAIHVDGVQGYLRTPFSMADLNVQSYAISAHKVHGPKGVGALILRPGHRVRPILVGGGQQGNLRSGTENTPGAVGFGAAIEHFPHCAYVAAQMKAFKQSMLEKLEAEVQGMMVLGPEPSGPDSAGHILSIAFPPVRAETLVHSLEQEGVLIGTGSACSSKKGKRSFVLTAMKVPPDVIDSTVRISFSPQNTREEVAFAAEKVIEKYQFLSKFRRR